MTKYILLLTLFFATPLFSVAQDIPDAPRPPRLVNDFARVLKASELQALESKLVNFDNNTSNQITVVLIKDLNGYDVSDYTFRLGEKWGVGRRGKDNGIVLLAAMNDRKTFIATGYGVEDVVPDAIAKRIVETYIIPNFKKGNYYRGLDEATNVLMDLTQGKYSDQVQRVQQPQEEDYIFRIIKIVLLLIFGIPALIVFSLLRGGGRTYSRRGYHGGGPWIGGSGGFGGRGGGGFGGFGGGSFGGGGAGGSW